MCGIAGIVSSDYSAVDQGSLKRMVQRVAHRGPDEEGFFFGRVRPRHQRSSIIDFFMARCLISNEDGKKDN